MINSNITKTSLDENKANQLLDSLCLSMLSEIPNFKKPNIKIYGKPPIHLTY